MSDEEIRAEYAVLEKSRKDPEAFGILYKKYFDRIFAFVYRQTDDADLAADLTSQTFLNSLKNVEKFTFRGVPVSAWFYKIASNEVNRYYRKKKSDKTFSLEEGKVRNLYEQANEGWDDELIERLLGYLAALPAEMLEVLNLRFFEDKDFKEIAFILDITESGAKMRTYRALDSLRKNFKLKIKYDGKG
ncbi:MAG TPA: sigma-70 family RNA polymerase sigma factor [Cyclobacteriaceae bacterium]|nr:sigma-70 family RNA polymerase sigma factor [Cyclobacteriaceae bacterium]